MTDHPCLGIYPWVECEVAVLQLDRWNFIIRPQRSATDSQLEAELSTEANLDLCHSLDRSR